MMLSLSTVISILSLPSQAHHIHCSGSNPVCSMETVHRSGDSERGKSTPRLSPLHTHLLPPSERLDPITVAVVAASLMTSWRWYTTATAAR